MTTRAMALWTIPFLVLVGCSDSSTSPDAGRDGGADAGSDAGVDGGEDAGTDAGSDAGEDAGPDAGSDAGADAGALSWYTTCGGALCQEPQDGGLTDDAGAPCPDAGTSCTSLGETCGTSNPHVDCGATEICDDHDPKTAGCPISSRKFKNDITYLDEGALARLHDETIAMRLATYEYKNQYGDPTEKHLGFIIEDQPQSQSVDRGHSRVDMYGYLSMVVATMQVQEKEIARLRKELETTRGSCRPAAAVNHTIPDRR